MQKRVDKSLKLLRELQEKLKTNNQQKINYHQNQNKQSFKTPQKLKTINQSYQQQQQQKQKIQNWNQQTADPDSNFKSHYIPIDSPEIKTLSNSYFNSPLNQCKNCVQMHIKNTSLQEQNKRMKNYINCLIKMNQFLKKQVLQQNQNLIKVQNQKQHMFEKENPQVTIMKMQIQYLKKLNDDRQKQIYQYHTDLNLNHKYLYRQLSDQCLPTPICISNNHSRQNSNLKNKKNKINYTSFNYISDYNFQPVIKKRDSKVQKSTNKSLLTKKRKDAVNNDMCCYSKNSPFQMKKQAKNCYKHKNNNLY